MDQGKDEGTVRRKLDQKTQDALRKLDAVESVTETRIQYSEGFRKTALERDRRGDSPAVIFREAGLDSAVIGYKRIERCMSRWTGNGVLDRFLEDESLFGEFLRTPVSEGGVESLVVEPPHIVVEVGA